ncbi:type III secretion system translocon subunit SctE [Candidatus Ichthyocystis sparus]|uniref:type III secretion system translocon subunit SctE n=1 Tax=Candidatus Ichthyocystis sparus TaxID=1561004 RepID=UPI001146B692|nr:type III secretion system translocon subunit SctE [Candidatus Ichthyocystis sparus]
MQSNVNPKEAGDVSSLAHADVVSEQVEEEQAKLDKASDDLNLTKLLEKISTTQDSSKGTEYNVRTLGQLMGDLSSDDTGPGQLKMPSGYEYLQNMSPEDAVVLIKDRSSSQVREMVAASVTRLRGAQDDYKKLHEKNVQKVQEYIEAGSSSVIDLIFKILLFIFLIVVAVVAIAAAVLTASPQMIIAAIAAVMGLVNSGLSIVSEITGEDVTFTGVLRRMAEGIEESLIEAGMSIEKAESVAKMLAGATGIATGLFLGDPGVIALFFEGAGQSAGMSESWARIFGVVMSFIAMIALAGATMNVGGVAASTGTVVSSVAGIFGSVDDVSKLASISDDIAKAVQAGVQATQAGYGMYQAKRQHDATLIQAEVSEIKGFLEALRNIQTLEEDMLEDLVSHLKEMQEMANESVQSILRSSGSAFRSMV